MRFILHKIESIPSIFPRGGPGPLPPLAQEGVDSEGDSFYSLSMNVASLFPMGCVDHIDTMSTEHNADLSSVYTSGHSG